MSIVLNMFLDEACTAKVGFQTPNSKQEDIIESMEIVDSWHEAGTVVDGSVIRIYAKVNVVKAKQPKHVLETYVDGKKVTLTPAEAPAPADDDIPF
jgi:hypothetical protein